VSHRVEQIVDKVQAILQASALFAEISVLQHRSLSLSNEDQELPAVSITLGSDDPLDDDGQTNLNVFDSLQALIFRIVAAGDDQDTEEHIIATLQGLRRAIHVALMADDGLGLAFVIGTRYGGADAPHIEAQQERLVGTLDCRWSVHYRVNIADPQ